MSQSYFWYDGFRFVEGHRMALRRLVCGTADDRRRSYWPPFVRFARNEIVILEVWGLA